MLEVSATLNACFLDFHPPLTISFFRALAKSGKTLLLPLSHLLFPHRFTAILTVSTIPMQVCPGHPQPFPRPGVGPEFAPLTGPQTLRCCWFSEHTLGGCCPGHFSVFRPLPPSATLNTADHLFLLKFSSRCSFLIFLFSLSLGLCLEFNLSCPLNAGIPKGAILGCSYHLP